MIKTLTYNQIDPQQWSELVQSSPTATWFQAKEAYEFYAANPEEMTPFALGVEEDGHLAGVIVGYTTQEKNPIKQFLTCRSIIIGGPLLDEHISSNALIALLVAVKQVTKKAIYVETRNFNDYSIWRNIFEANGFAYQPHLNYHVDTTSLDQVQSRIGKHRWRYIRLSMRDGAKIVDNPTIEQVRAFYTILQDLYRSKVRTPLWSWDFFEQLYHVEHARYILVELDGKIVGGTACVCLPGKAVYEWYACGLDDCRDDIRPLSVAIWGEMQYAAENGYPLFDFMGAGTPDQPYGVRDFKAEFGGELVEYGRFLCVRKPLLYWIGKMGVKFLKRKRKYNKNMANNHRTLGNVMRGVFNRICLGIAHLLFPAQLRLPFYRATGMKIGKGSKIAATVDVDQSAPELITIGKNVWVTRGVMILCHQRDLNEYEVDKPVMDCPLVYKPVVIKDGAHIGIGAIIMPGVTIGKGAVIGAGSVVTRDIPDYCVAVGSPAKVIKTFETISYKNSNNNLA